MDGPGFDFKKLEDKTEWETYEIGRLHLLFPNVPVKLGDEYKEAAAEWFKASELPSDDLLRELGDGDLRCGVCDKSLFLECSLIQDPVRMPSPKPRPLLVTLTSELAREPHPIVLTNDRDWVQHHEKGNGEMNYAGNKGKDTDRTEQFSGYFVNISWRSNVCCMNCADKCLKAHKASSTLASTPEIKHAFYNLESSACQQMMTTLPRAAAHINTYIKFVINRETTRIQNLLDTADGDVSKVMTNLKSRVLFSTDDRIGSLDGIAKWSGEGQDSKFAPFGKHEYGKLVDDAKCCASGCDKEVDTSTELFSLNKLTIMEPVNWHITTQNSYRLRAKLFCSPDCLKQGVDECGYAQKSKSCVYLEELARLIRNERAATQFVFGTPKKCMNYGQCGNNVRPWNFHKGPKSQDRCPFCYLIPLCTQCRKTAGNKSVHPATCFRFADSFTVPAWDHELV